MSATKHPPACEPHESSGAQPPPKARPSLIGDPLSPYARLRPFVGSVFPHVVLRDVGSPAH